MENKRSESSSSFVEVDERDALEDQAATEDDKSNPSVPSKQDHIAKFNSPQTTSTPQPLDPRQQTTEQQANIKATNPSNSEILEASEAPQDQQYVEDTDKSLKPDPLKELEDAAQQTLIATREATAKLAKNAAEAKEHFTSFVSSLWSSLDPPSSSKTAAQQRDAERLKEHLGLHVNETILETFRCKLIQSYSATNNSFTPPKQIGFTCQLHFATNEVCIELDSDRISPPVKIPATEIVSFERQGGDTVVVKLKGDQEKSVVFGQFALPKLEVDSVLALLEHLVSTKVSGSKG